MFLCFGSCNRGVIITESGRIRNNTTRIRILLFSLVVYEMPTKIVFFFVERNNVLVLQLLQQGSNYNRE
jgi:hypothetical protein